MNRANFFLNVFKDSADASVSGDLDRLKALWERIGQSNVNDALKEKAQHKFFSIVSKTSLHQNQLPVLEWLFSQSIDPYLKQKTLKNLLSSAGHQQRAQTVQALVKYWNDECPNAGANANLLLPSMLGLQFDRQCVELLAPLCTPVERHAALLEASRMDNHEIMDVLIPYCNIRSVISEQLDDDEDIVAQDLYLFKRWQDQQLNKQLSQDLLPASACSKPSKM